MSEKAGLFGDPWFDDIIAEKNMTFFTRAYFNSLRSLLAKETRRFNDCNFVFIYVLYIKDDRVKNVVERTIQKPSLYLTL